MPIAAPIIPKLGIRRRFKAIFEIAPTISLARLSLDFLIDINVDPEIPVKAFIATPNESILKATDPDVNLTPKISFNMSPE